MKSYLAKVKRNVGFYRMVSYLIVIPGNCDSIASARSVFEISRPFDLVTPFSFLSDDETLDSPSSRCVRM